MADSADVLFELGTEELPPRALRRLGEALLAGFREGLEQAHIDYTDARGFATPRRLAVLIQECPVNQPEKESERLGPPLAAAYDAAGSPTAAAEGFARSCGVAVDSLERVTTDKGERLACRWREPGQPSVELLPRIAEQAVHRLPIPKRMRWGESTVQFVRPVHWLVFLMGEQVVSCELLGLHAGRQSMGHRFHGSGAIALNHPSDYERRLKHDGFVIAPFDERKEVIRSQVERLGSEAGGQADMDDDLLDEVTALTEWPVAIQGSFDEAFLTVPVELLVMTMKQDQRYFPIFDSTGALTNRFIVVANIDSSDPDVVRQGNERVIRPRFADAKFFWDQDRKRPLESRLEDLKQVVFQERLGTMYVKSARVAALASDIALLIAADTDKAGRAGWLSRCDLVTETVFEFPAMQGIAGRHLLTHEKADAELARAMDEFYMPRHAGGDLPETRTGTAISLAEKLDTLVGIFAIGESPSGDKDPYALRRAALGALRMLKEKRLRIPLWAVLEIANHRLDEALRTEETVEHVYAFMMERLKGIYLDEEIDSSVFSAVLEVEPSTVVEFDRRVKAVTAFRALPEAGALAEANKRARNILRKADFDDDDAEVDAAQLSEPAEVQLSEQTLMLERQIEPLLESGDYEAALKLLAGLKDPLDRFFVDVMVMSEDPVLRGNRLALLFRLSRLFLRVADISQLQISTRHNPEDR
ncbi:MAG: Glycine--tRNA ligase beta subunit [Gammaproteobacteria bacterium]|nr:Glycine--tRNA ligase beta subunit [Gammaproteobacteria bacterium]